jgi:hypothetical protein
MVIVIGSMTLFIFFARYLVFRFHESPKFLVSKGREQDAIDVLHKIAKFNGATPPTLTVEDFRAIDHEMGITPTEQTGSSDAKGVVMRAIREVSFLRGLFLNKLACFTFVLLGLAYMVRIFRDIRELIADSSREITGPSTWLERSYRSSCSVTMSTLVPIA